MDDERVIETINKCLAVALSPDLCTQTSQCRLASWPADVGGFYAVFSISRAELVKVRPGPTMRALVDGICDCLLENGAWLPAGSTVELVDAFNPLAATSQNGDAFEIRFKATLPEPN
jgi:hypothetical protein